MSTYFVTATGTDLGKTYVLCRILAQLRSRGESVHALKPVLSGFDASDAASTDSGRLLLAQGLPVNEATISAITPWRFLPPLSPDMAAARAGVTVSLGEVERFCRKAEAGHGRLFVEGAGGVMSPLGSDFLNIDLMARLKAKAILVCGGYLGTISHTLTALTALKSRDVPVAAIVLSGSGILPVPLEETQQSLMRFQSVPVYGVDAGGDVPVALVDALLT
jgi:dethiobiotin synthetase